MDILPRWVLTAGHCLTRKCSLTAYFGSDENDEYTDEIEIPLTNQHIHPNYIDDDFPSNDIGWLFSQHGISTLSYQITKCEQYNS